MAIAPIAWVVSGEMPSLRLRSMTLGFESAFLFFIFWLITFTAPYFINTSSLNWGPKYGYIWFVSGIATALFVWRFVPELQGRSLEEADVMVSGVMNLWVTQWLTFEFSLSFAFQRGIS